MAVDEEGEQDFASDGETLRRLLDAMERANPASRQRLVTTLATYFDINISSRDAPHRPASAPASTLDASTPEDRSSSFSESRAPSPKEFMLEKRPQTDVERIACLAYYLTHYRDESGFKTLDLSKLNAEAAHLKLSNAAQAVDNATKSGFLITHVKGQKKLSALGELYVQGLPDRAAARAAMSNARPKRRKAKSRDNGNR